MPMKLNAGLCQKVSDNHYGSRGASVNLELELDSALVSEPAKLQEKIRKLFALVRASLTEELKSSTRPAQNGSTNGNGAVHNGNGSGSNNGSARQNTANAEPKPPRPATQSQVKAIFAITRAQGRNVGTLLNDRFRVAYPEQHNIKQASTLIDELKRAGEGGEGQSQG